jgi:hypothetical protein
MTYLIDQAAEFRQLIFRRLHIDLAWLPIGARGLRRAPRAAWPTGYAAA